MQLRFSLQKKFRLTQDTFPNRWRGLRRTAWALVNDASQWLNRF